jgi:molybdenum cofactor biosynthesis enzyme MoaA
MLLQPTETHVGEELNPADKASLFVLKREFLDLCGRGADLVRYRDSKFELLKQRWPSVKALVTTGEVQTDIRHLEVHISERCQLACEYCRGQLREIPSREEVIDIERLLTTLDVIIAAGTTPSIRISGTIGDPLTHPQAADLFRQLNVRGIPFGLTTNGISLMKPGIFDGLLQASYLHISLDAGSEQTYRRLKKGPPGTFGRVLSNIDAFLAARRNKGATTRVVVSCLLQPENGRELDTLATTLDAMGVDLLEIKMQHYDHRRTMSREQIDHAYTTLHALESASANGHLQVVEVQDYDQALVRLTASPQIRFSRCYSNLLGLNSTIDPRGAIQTCCQYYQSTLGRQGNIGDGILGEWRGAARRNILNGDPRLHCISCSPSDEYVNRFVEVLRSMYQVEPASLEWAETVMSGAPISLAPGGARSSLVAHNAA